MYVYHIVAAGGITRGYIHCVVFCFYGNLTYFFSLRGNQVPCINLYKMFAQIAGNAVSDVLNFKIFQGRMPPYPLQIMWLN